MCVASANIESVRVLHARHKHGILCGCSGAGHGSSMGDRGMRHDTPASLLRWRNDSVHQQSVQDTRSVDPTCNRLGQAAGIGH